PAQETLEAGVVRAAVPGGQVERGGDRVAGVEHAQLEAARPGVDHQHAGHDGGVAAAGVPCGHVQFATSGMSSPCSRVQARALVRLSAIRCRSQAALLFSPGTRSMTSITRWNRSMSFSITMSNG